jgi:AcrR family transcriptional regulator
MREKLITATIELINKHGLKFTMDELAALVHVSKRSLYEEFASKTVLIGAVCQYIIGNLETQEETSWLTGNCPAAKSPGSVNGSPRRGRKL